MIVAIGAMALFQIPLGIASIGGLLCCLDIQLTQTCLQHRYSKERRELLKKGIRSMKTGLTMTITAICSFAVLFIISLIAYVSNIL